MPGLGFRGWWVLGVACLVVMLSNGMTLGGITVFDPDLLEHLQTGRGDLKLRDLFQMLTAAAAAPLLGLLADRVGVRYLMMAGLSALAVGFAGYPFVQSLADVYALHVLLGLGLAATGLVLAVSVVSRWFATRRGFALGLVLAGGSIGNALLPPLNSALNASLGWKNAFFVLAAVPLALLPAVIMLVRERPSDVGQLAFGQYATSPIREDDRERTEPRSAAASPPTFIGALRTREFACLAVLAFTTFSALVGLTAHTFLILKDQGFSDARAAFGLTVLFAFGLVGKLAAGIVSDRTGIKPALFACLLIVLTGALLLASVVGTAPWLTLAVLGLGWGGIYTLQQLTAAALFSGPALGRIVGSLVLVDSVGAALGPWMLGRAYDAFGTYRPAYMVIIGALSAALLAAIALRVPPVHMAIAAMPETKAP
jgi:sugar phosphate permease